MIRIGLLTSTGFSSFNTEALKPILKDENIRIEFVLIDNRPKKSLKQKWKKNLKRGRGGYMMVMAFKSFFAKKKTGCTVVDFCSENNIPFLKTTKPYSTEIIEKINNLNLDLLILLGGYGVIKEPLLNTSRLGVLSYHHGDMRKYRGMPPALWEIYHNEKKMGVTVQLLSKGLDCGIPVEEKSIKIEKKDNVRTLRERAYFESHEMLYKAVTKLSDSEYVPRKISRFGEVYTLPNFRQWLTLQSKIGMRKII